MPYLVHIWLPRVTRITAETWALTHEIKLGCDAIFALLGAMARTLKVLEHPYDLYQ